MPTLPDRDSNRSDYLFIERAVDENNEPMLYAEYWGYDDRETPEDETDDEHLYFIRWYVLKDSLNTNAHCGEIWLFDPELQRIGTWDLAQLPCVDHQNQPDGLTASASGVRHGVLVRVPVSLMVTPGEYLFMVHAVDDHVAHEKCHRRKPALPLNAQLRFNIDRVELYYRNNNDPQRLYPFVGDSVSLRAIVYLRVAGGNSLPYWRHRFISDGNWYATGTGRLGDAIPDVSVDWSTAPEPRLPPGTTIWPAPNSLGLQFTWYRLTHSPDKETSLTQLCTWNTATTTYRWYFYEPYTIILGLGWGGSLDMDDTLRGTHRYMVRVDWRDRPGNHFRCSPGPVPGRVGDNPTSWNLTWSQNCTQPEHYAVRISVRRRDVGPEDLFPSDLQYRYLQWLTAFIRVPYDWGGAWFGGGADGTYTHPNQTDSSDRTREYDLRDVYGTDCSGLVSAAAKFAGYNFGPWRLVANDNPENGLAHSKFSDPVFNWNDLKPGDIIVGHGHVLTIYDCQPGRATTAPVTIIEAVGSPADFYRDSEDRVRTATIDLWYWYIRRSGWTPRRLRIR